MKIQIVADHGTSHSAWTKAPADVAKVAEGLGFVRVSAGRFRLGNFSFIRRALRKLRLEHGFERLCWKLELWALRRRFGKDGGELLLQHPLPGSWSFDSRNVDDVARLKHGGVKITVLVHDIGALRGRSKDVGGRGMICSEIGLFQIADKLVVHNEKMKVYLAENGVDDAKMVVLCVFDYLTGYDVGKKTNFHWKRNDVIVAGGMGLGKSGYLTQLKSVRGVCWHLYGPGYDAEKIGGKNVIYHGCFPTDEIPSQLCGAFGLVWDGDSVDTCAGATGDYLRYNNPHKLSLYIASNLPVVVWSQSAISNFVLQNGIGFTVDSVYEIAEKIAKLPESDYENMLVAVSRLGVNVRQGKFLTCALECGNGK